MGFEPTSVPWVHDAQGTKIWAPPESQAALICQCDLHASACHAGRSPLGRKPHLAVRELRSHGSAYRGSTSPCVTNDQGNSVRSWSALGAAADLTNDPAVAESTRELVIVRAWNRGLLPSTDFADDGVVHDAHGWSRASSSCWRPDRHTAGWATPPDARQRGRREMLPRRFRSSAPWGRLRCGSACPRQPGSSMSGLAWSASW